MMLKRLRTLWRWIGVVLVPVVVLYIIVFTWDEIMSTEMSFIACIVRFAIPMIAFIMSLIAFGRYVTVEESEEPEQEADAHKKLFCSIYIMVLVMGFLLVCAGIWSIIRRSVFNNILWLSIFILYVLLATVLYAVEAGGDLLTKRCRILPWRSLYYISDAVSGAGMFLSIVSITAFVDGWVKCEGLEGAAHWGCAVRLACNSRNVEYAICLFVVTEVVYLVVYLANLLWWVFAGFLSAKD